MFLGRYQLGQEVPLGVLTVDGSGTPSAPTVAPHVDVFSASAKPVKGKLLPVIDRSAQPGLFGLRLYLGGLFAAGRYTAVYRWKVGTFLGQGSDEFEVIAGGHADGEVLAMHWYDRPHAKFIVRHLSSGTVGVGRNPRLGG